MTRTRLRPPVRAHAGRLLLLAATLAGLFTAHGGHGTTDPHAATAAHDAAAPHRASIPALDDHHGAGLLGLCLAVLAALLALALRLRPDRRTALAVLQPVGVREPARTRTRGPGPPDLLALGIQRC